MKVILIRFLVGGAVVSFFAVLGDLFKPKTFAGLFGAAPSVALATLGLTAVSEGKLNASIEAKSMMAGAVAFFVYACCTSCVMMRGKFTALWITSSWLLVWGAVAFGLWRLFIR